MLGTRYCKKWRKTAQNKMMWTGFWAHGLSHRSSVTFPNIFFLVVWWFGVADTANNWFHRLQFGLFPYDFLILFETCCNFAVPFTNRPWTLISYFLKWSTNCLYSPIVSEIPPSSISWTGATTIVIKCGARNDILCGQSTPIFTHRLNCQAISGNIWIKININM